MKKISWFIYFVLSIHIIVGCEDKGNSLVEPPVEDNVNTVSQFVYDGMSTYYKWAEDIRTKRPTSQDNNPYTYFDSLLSEPDTQHGWSWLTDDVDGLLKRFSGNSVGFGYKLFFVMFEERPYAVVKYVFKDTPASEAGVERLHLIGELNGNPIRTVKKNGKTYIASEDVNILFGEKSATFTLYKLEEGALKQDKKVTATPRNIRTNPVLFDKIYTVGSKKIGYLFYTSFIYNYNPELYKVFEKFKAANVTDLVLDLRYNHGGAISSASYLASMIAPATHVQNHAVLTTLDYNKDVNKLFDTRNWQRSDKLGEYNERDEQNPLNVNLNLQKVYIIATSDSFSASELTTFCLKPYMEVVQIGNKTGGKYTASWTLTPFEKNRTINIYDKKKNFTAAEKKDLENWGMQPIVAIYTDKNGQTFMETDGLIPEPENTFKEGFGALAKWTPLGDTKDVFLGQALYLITGDATYKPKAPKQTKSSFEIELQDITPNAVADKVIKESVILDAPQLMLN